MATFIDTTSVFGKNVIIEDNVYIGPYCIIGFPAEWKGYEKEDCGVIIRSGTRITGMVTIDSGGVRATEIGKDCYIMKQSYIAHDCKIGDNVTISSGARIAGKCIIGKNTNIGMNAVIHQKQIIAEDCMIGMGSVITKKLLTVKGMKYVGNPARLLGENIKK